MENELVENNIFAVVIFGIFFIIAWVAVRSRRPHGIPPGPTPLPLIGNVLQLRGGARKALKQLRRQYGDVFSLYIGTNLAVVFNGYEAINEAFVKNGDVFSDRPKIASYLPASNLNGVGRSSGEVWKKNKRFVVSTLRDFGMGKNKLQMEIQKEAEFLIREVEKKKGEAFDLKHLISMAVSNIISNITFGRRFEYDDERYRQCLELMSIIIHEAPSRAMMTGLDFLRFLPGDILGIKQQIKVHQGFYDFIKRMVEESLESYDENNVRSLVDAYIKQEKIAVETLSSGEIWNMDLLRIVGDVYATGSDTTSTFTFWTLLYMMQYPDVQEKASAQVHDALGGKHLPGMEDRLNMPYLEATINEVLRKTFAPLNMPHSVREDTTFRHYSIPKNAMAIMNFDSVMYDESRWTRSDEFNPDRFMDNGSVKKVDCFIPFSLGKRSCMGESLARMALIIFIGSLIKHFKFLPPKGQKGPMLEERDGLPGMPVHQLVRAIKRS